MSRRARALAMLGLSAICAGLAASLVNRHAAEVSAQVGDLVPVLVARTDIPPGRSMTAANAGVYLSERKVPRRFAPPDGFHRIRQAVGLRARVRVPAGSYIGASQLGPAAARRSPAIATSEAGRAVEIPIAGAASLGAALQPGARVDVLVTSERAPGPARTYVALQRVEVIDFRATATGGPSGDPGEADGVAALRVSLRQAVLLTAAQNFASELRLVPRPRGDGERVSALSVSAADLHP